MSQDGEINEGQEQIQQATNEAEVTVPAAEVLSDEATRVSNLSGVKDFLEKDSSSFSFTKKAFAIDKGHIRSFDVIKQNIINYLLNSSNSFLKNFTSEDFYSEIKDSDLANMGKNISPADEEVFMPLLVDENNQFKDWIPVKLNIEEINNLSIDKCKKVKKRHPNTEKKGLFERKKIKLSNFNLNTDREVLNENRILGEDESRSRKITKGITRSLLRSRKVQQKFNEKFGRDNEDIEAEQIDNEEIELDNKVLEKIEYGNQIKKAIELGEEYLKQVLNFASIKFGVPFIKLTPRGLLLDFMSAVNIQNSYKASIKSSVIIKFGKTFSVNYLGSELRSANNIQIGNRETFLMSLGFNSLIHDPSQNDSLFKASNFNISATGLNGDIMSNMTSNEVTYHTQNGFSIFNGDITLDANIGGFKGSVNAFNITINNNIVKLFSFNGSLNKIPLTKFFSVNNIMVSGNFNNSSYIINGQADFNFNSSLMDVGLENLELNGQINIISDSTINNLRYSLINGNLIGKFLLNDEQNKIDLNGISYNSDNPHQIKANFFQAKNFNLYGYHGNLTILKPEINNSGFNFDLTAGKIEELSVGKFLNLKNIKVYISKIGQNYNISARTNFNFNLVSPIPGFESDISGGGEFSVNRSETSQLNYSVTDGQLHSTIFDNTFELKGIEYESTSPNEISAEQSEWKGNIYSKDISVIIINPKIDDQNGFTFDEAKGQLSDLNLANVIQLQNIILTASKHQDNYKLSGESDVKISEINGLEMFGQSATINSASGKVRYDSENENKISIENGAISLTVNVGGSQTDLTLEGLNTNNGTVLSIGSLDGTFSYNEFGISGKKITGDNIKIQNSEITYSSLNASGLGIDMSQFSFLSAVIENIELRNDTSEKKVLIGFRGELKNIYDQNLNEEEFGAEVTGNIGWDAAQSKKIFDITNLAANLSVRNPLNELGDLIKDFSSGRIDIGASIPVFPGIFAEFGFFLESALQLGGSNLNFSANLNKVNKQIDFSMAPADIANGYIASGVYAGIQAGSKLLLALAIFLEAYGKASADLKVSFNSSLSFQNPKSPLVKPKPNTFYGFDYSLVAIMLLSADLKAVASAFYFFNKTFRYNLGTKNLGEYTYTPSEKSSQTPKSSLVENEKDFNIKGGLEDEEYQNLPIKKLIQLNPTLRFDKSQKQNIANRFSSEISDEQNEELNTGISANLSDYERSSLVSIRQLRILLSNLDQISEFQHNRFDWAVISQNLNDIYSILPRVKVEYESNKTKSGILSRIFGKSFNYTAFKELVLSNEQAESEEENYDLRNRLQNSIDYIKKLDEVSRNFNTATAFNAKHTEVLNKFNIKVNQILPAREELSSLTNETDKISLNQENSIHQLNIINRFKGGNLHSSKKKDLKVILEKSQYMKDDFHSKLVSNLKVPSTTYNNLYENFLENSKRLKNKIKEKEKEINIEYNQSRLANLASTE